MTSAEERGPGTGADDGAGPESEGTAERRSPGEEAIREEVRELTAQMLRTGRIDTERVRELSRAMTAGTGPAAAADAHEAFADAMARLDEALMRSAESTHEILQRLAAKGESHTDNDIKEALARLEQLQRDYVATASRVAEAASGNLQRELRDLASHAQRVGADAAAQVASLLGEFTRRIGGTSREGAVSGLEATREYGMRMAFFTSGILAGIADALREQPPPKSRD